MTLGTWFLERIWYVHPKTSLRTTLQPDACMQVLVTMAKPSVQRLEHRNLFAQGRRYFFSLRTHNNTPEQDKNQARPGKTQGFYMASTHKLLWSRKRRTQSAAIITGKFDKQDDHITRITIQGRMRLMYMLDILPLPAFATSLIVFMPWHPMVIGVLVALLFGLSWVGHRYHAALEAHTMVYFLERALENYIATPVLLETNDAHIV
jgi:hypothetical protein